MSFQTVHHGFFGIAYSINGRTLFQAVHHELHLGTRLFGAGTGAGRCPQSAAICDQKQGLAPGVSGFWNVASGLRTANRRIKEISHALQRFATFHLQVT
jgi:hypothetical protein